MTQDIVQALEGNIRKYKESVELHNAMERLRNNKDFQLVITKGYLQDEAVRLVHLRGEPGLDQEAILAGINGIAQLVTFIRAIGHTAQQAVKAIEADEATLEEVVGEEQAK